MFLVQIKQIFIDQIFSSQIIIISVAFMGCVASDASSPGITTLYASRSPIVSNLSDKNKDKLAALIEKDDIINLAIVMADVGAMSHSQISDLKMNWMLTHLCCRWDADNCLQYLLKDYFCQHPIGYIDFINAPTVEGYTCLHLCALWKSEKCFYVIHNYGGLNLNAKDKTNKTPYETACQYKCQKMKETLEAYRSFRSLRLMSKQLIAEDIHTQMKNKEDKGKQAKKIISKVSEADKAINNLSQIEKQMLLQKEKLQKQKQQILQAKLKQQMDAEEQKKKAINAAKIEEVKKLQQQKRIKDQIDQRLKLQNEKLANQLKAKQAELNKVKQDLKMVEQKRIQEQKEEAQKKAELFIKQKQEQIDRKIKQKEDTIVLLKKQQQEKAKKQKQDADNRLKQIQIQHAKKEQQLNAKLKQKQDQIEKIKKDEQARKKQQEQAANKQTQEAMNKAALEYSKKLKQKQDQVAILKNQETQRLKRQKQEAERKAIEQVKQKTQAQTQQNQAAAQQSQAQQNQAQQNQAKQPVNNPTVPAVSAANQLKQAFKKINEQAPPQIQKLYTEAKALGAFFDKEFPAVNQTIGDSSKRNFAALTTNTVWLRPQQFINGKFQLFNGIEPNDIKQGSLGVCYMLATLSVLAEAPKNIQKMFIFSNIQIGFYILKFFVHGKPKFVIVDDFIPCNKTTKSPLFTKPIGNQIWVLLVEKAWAKTIGDYLSAQAMTPDYLMQDLSSAPSFGSWFEKDNKPNTQHIKTITKHSDLEQIIVITSGEKKIEGIANNHAYSMLQSYQVNGRYIFKVRNPWGRFEWNGQYGNTSSLWTPELKKLVGWEDKDDGIFYITQTELTYGFVYYSICEIVDTSIYSFVQFKSKQQQDLFYKIKVNKPGSFNLRVTQLFDRMLKDKSYKYSPLVFQVGKIVSPNAVTFISQGHQKSYFGAKSVHAFENICQNFEAGQYFIRIRMLWNNEEKYNSAVLGAYGPQNIKFQKLSSQQGLKLTKLMLYSQSADVKKKATGDGFYKIITMKGQFVFIGQTDKEGKYKITFKFTKANMQLCQLDYGKTSQTDLVLYMSKTEPGVGTAMRLEPSKGGTTGSVSILVEKA